MSQKKSHEIFADFYADMGKNGGKRMAAAHGVHTDTAVAWSRPKVSDVNPTATGKGNPIDAVVRTMRVIHPHDPARAREIIDHLEEEADELDRQAGIFEADESSHACRAVGKVVTAQAKLILSTLGDCDDPKSYADSLEKTRTLKSSVIQLESCLKRLAKNSKK